jgi:uncharacterized membrane protein SirB2
MLDRLPSSFVNHIELWLSGVGLLLIFGVAFFMGSSGAAFWRLIAIIAVGIGVVHGLIFWAVRRRQRRVRRQSIREIRQMLSDVLKNKLATINMYLPEEEIRNSWSRSWTASAPRSRTSPTRLKSSRRRALRAGRSTTAAL